MFHISFISDRPVSMAKVFISYKRQDKNIVFPIVDEIRRQTGVDCWIDIEGIESGEQFQKVIINEIDRVDTVIIMLSQNFIAPYKDEKTGKIDLKKQTFPEKEVMYALRHGKRLIPISIDGTTVYDCKWLEFHCGDLDCINWGQEDQQRKLLNNLRQWSGQETDPGFIQSTRHSINWDKYKSWIPYAIVCLLSLFVGCYVGKINSHQIIEKVIEDKPMLLIAGGGSVANFIEEQPGTLIPKLADYPGGYYVHLPTKSAWKMLVEEVVSLQDTRRYYPICISAVEATDEDFLNAQISQKMYLDSAIVVSSKLGEDSLAVYIQEKSEFIDTHPECLISKQISVTQLKELVKSKTMNVFSTSVESGTRAGYCDILGIENAELNEYLAGQFSEFSPISSVCIGNTPFLLLGSKYYKMTSVRNDAVRLIVQTDYVKPMIVYFMAYSQGGDVYKIPSETMEFLNRLNLHNLDNYISNDGCIKIKKRDHVIFDEHGLIDNLSK